MKQLPVYPMNVVEKLLPNLSHLHRWMHGVAKNHFRDFINMYGECYEVQEILKRKLDPAIGWVNPEIKFLYEEVFGCIIEHEKVMWEAIDDVTTKGESINRNERFWRNLRNVVCTFLDEDSYYVLRFFEAIDVVLENPDAFNLKIHKEKIYWNWQELRLKLKEMARQRRLVREGWDTSESVEVKEQIT